MRYIDLEKLLTKRQSWGHSIELWKNENLKNDFRNYFYNKCWYTEVSLSGSDCPIDHFRPKSAIERYKNFNYNYPIANVGYYWLKNSPENYRASCTYANRKTHGGGKGCYFPLLKNSPYLTQNGNEKEEPMLLDPCNKNDVNLITFIGGEVVPATSNSIEKSRVEVTKNIYNLDNSYIKNDRTKVWDEIIRYLDMYDNNDINEDALLKQLKYKISREHPFSACAIACINSCAPDKIKDQLDLTL